MGLRFLITIGLIIVAEFYSFILVRSMTRNLPKPWRIGVFSLYIFLSLLAWASMLLVRKIDWSAVPHMTKNLLVAFTIGFFVGKILIMAVMLIDDIRRVIMFIISRLAPATDITEEAVASRGISRSQFLKSIALLLGGLSLGGFLLGITNRYNYQVKRVRVRLPNLPSAFRGLKILQLSDIHAGSFDSPEAVERGVALAMEQRPDVIVFTGDLVNNKAEELRPFVDIFSKLKAPYGVYSVLGNHDYGDYVEWPTVDDKVSNLEELKQLQQKMGWKLLLNEHVVLEREGEKIALLGVENWSNRAHFPRHGNLNQAYRGLESNAIGAKILLSHDPSHFDAQVSTQFPDIDLTLSGHTHGMQFGIEIPGFKWSPVKYVYEKWAGLYQVGHQQLYVNRGYGFLGYPGRVGILPEITVIELA